MQKSLANDSLRRKFRSGELCWVSTGHLLRKFGGNVGVIQELLPTEQVMIHHDTLLPALELLCFHTLYVSSERPQLSEATMTELAILCRVSVCIHGRFLLGKDYICSQRENRDDLPSKQQNYMALAFRGNMMSLFHLPPLLFN